MFKLSSNPRCVMTMNRIVDAFFVLLHQRYLRQISISELCLKAKVSRKTFYRNFNKRKDVVDYAIYVRMKRFDIQAPVNFRGYLVAVFAYCLKYRDTFTLFNDRGAFGLLAESIERYLPASSTLASFLRKVDWPLSIDPVSWQAFIALELAYLRQWVERGFDQTPEQAAEGNLRLLRFLGGLAQ